MSQDLEIETSTAELEFRDGKYPDPDVLLQPGSDDPNCTVCSKTLDRDVDFYAHPLLKVLVCKSCFSFYNKGDFSSDEDGTDKYCRWCGQGGSLYCCSKCRCAFCRKCVKRNCGKRVLKDIEEDDWNCFVCNVKPLWKVRAYCWAIIESKKERSRLAKLKNRAALEDLGRKISIPKSRTRRPRYKSSNSNSDNGSESSKGSKRRLRLRKAKANNVDHSSSSESEEPEQRKKTQRNNTKKKHKSSDDDDFFADECKDDGKEKKLHVKRKKKTQSKHAKSSEDGTDSENSSDSDVEFVEKVTKKSSHTKRKLKPKHGKPNDDDDSEKDSENASDSEVEKKKKKRDNMKSKGAKSSEQKKKTVNQETKESSSEHSEPVHKGKKHKKSTNCREDSDKEPAEKTSKPNETTKIAKSKETSQNKSAEANGFDSDSDGTSNCGGSESESQKNEWFINLISDLNNFSTQTNKKLNSIQQSASEGMIPENIDATCRVLYRHVKKSIKFLESYKSNISADYSEWRGKRERKASKKHRDSSKTKALLPTEETTPNSSEETVAEDVNASEQVDNPDETNESGVSTSSGFKTGCDHDESIDEASKNMNDKQDTTVKKIKPKIGPKSKVARKPSTGSDDEAPATQKVVSQESEENSPNVDTASTQLAPNESKVDGAIPDATIRSSLAALEEEATKIRECLSKEVVDQLSKTLNSATSRHSVDPFEDDESISITDKSTVFDDATVNLEETNEQHILDMDTEGEISQVTDMNGIESAADVSQTTYFEEENGNKEDAFSTMEKDKILNQTTQEELNKSPVSVTDTLPETETSPEKVVSTDNETSPEKEASPEKEVGSENEESPEKEVGSDNETSLEVESRKKEEECLNALLASSDEDNTPPISSPVKRKIGPKSKVARPDSCDGEESGKKKRISKRKIGPKSKMSRSDFSDSDCEPVPDKIHSCESSDLDEKVDETENNSDLKKEEECMNALLVSSDEDNTPSISTVKRKMGPKSKVARPDSCDSDGSDKTKRVSKRKVGPKSKISKSDVSDSDSEQSFSRIMLPQLSCIENADEFDDDKQLLSKCYVKLEKLTKTATGRKGSRRKSGYSSDQEIANLTNLSRVGRKNRAAGEGSSTKKKTRSKSTKKKEDNESASSADENSEGNCDDEVEQQPLLFDTSIVTSEEMAARAILISSDSDLSIDESGETDKKKKVKKEKEDASKAKVKSEKIKATPLSGDSSGSEKDVKKRASWRNAKELREPLSDLGTSDEDTIFQKMKNRQSKEDKDSSNSDEEFALKSRRSTQEKKKKAKRQVFSDSDIEVIQSDSDTKDKSDGDSSDIFQPKKKNKRTRSSDTSSSNSDDSSKKKTRKRRRIRKPASDSDSDSDDIKESQKSEGTPGKRKNIRKVLKERHLEKTTREAAKEEEDRKKRIAERQALYNQIVEGKQIEKGSILQELVLDFNEETKETILEVDKELVSKLKPHQAQGVKFMWDALFESVHLAKKNRGSGCILAHCMGLGKTFQVVTLAHTILTHPELKLGVRTILVVTPLSTVNNWCHEFSMWLKDIGDGDEVQCYNFTQSKPRERAIYLKNWQKYGGVAVMGYDMFRNLSTENKRHGKATTQTYQTCLIDPGPDLIVCDEGHMLKNEKSKLSQCMSRVKTYRRVALTGTPLQNNLVEYHCMIQFVKPNLLGKRNEFTNRFVNPIKNGQCADSTERDVLVMKRRAHVLHKMLEGCVQRFDYSVLTPLLKPKHEYVMKIRLTDIQIKLYQYYMDNMARQSSTNKGATLFQDYQNLQRVWTHPMVMKLRSDRDEDKFLEDEAEDSEGSLKEFIDDDDESEASDKSSSSSRSNSDSDSDVVCEDDENSSSKKRKKKNKNEDKSNKKYRTRGAVASGEVEEEKEGELSKGPSLWWHEFVKDEDLEIMSISNKMVILFNILRECEAIGDKVLVFSQSLMSLDLIELFLSRVDEANQEDADTSQYANLKGSWSMGLDYFRIDGQSSTENRSMWCKTFNNPNNLRARLFLISTRAGGLGINMVGANRVVLFDASWNPSNDVQSIFRIYRFGQVKPCYIYRFLAAGTMEEKIYDRQVTKLALSGRVVDEHQIDRHFNAADLEELYSFNPIGLGDERPTMLVPKDRLLAELLKQQADLIESYHEHDSLLENKPEENLTEEERQAAWNDYETEKNYQENKLLAMEQQYARQQEIWRLQQQQQLQLQQQMGNGMMNGMNPLAMGAFDTDKNLQNAFMNLKNSIAMNNRSQGGTSAPMSDHHLKNIFASALSGNKAALNFVESQNMRYHQNLMATQGLAQLPAAVPQPVPLVDLSNGPDLTPTTDKWAVRKQQYGVP